MPPKPPAAPPPATPRTAKPAAAARKAAAAARKAAAPARKAAQRPAAGVADSPARHDARPFDPTFRTTYRFALIATLGMRCLSGLFTGRHGLTTNGWRALNIIGRYEPIHPSEVADRTTMERDRVTRTVDTLVAAGWVSRRADPQDGRRVQLRLTRGGRVVYRDVERLRLAIEGELLGALADDELRVFYAAVAKLEARARDTLTGRDAWQRLLPRQTARTRPAKD